MNATMNALPNEIFRRWGHSFEEDSGDSRVYRPQDYAFPRARGRAGIEFRANGQFIEWAVGRGDAPQEVTGHWHLTGPNQLLITFAETTRANQLLEILEVTADVLRVRPRSS